MHRLRTKVFLISLAVVLTAAVVLGVGGIYFLKAHLEHEFNLRVLGLTRAFTLISAENLVQNRLDLIEKYLASLVADPDLDDAHLLDTDGHILVSKAKRRGVPPFQLDRGLFSKTLRAFTQQSREVKEAGRRYKIVYHQVWSESANPPTDEGNRMGIMSLGVCTLRFGYHRLDSKIWQATVIYGSFVVLFSLLAALLGYAGSVKITRPLEQLRAAAVAVGQGEYAAVLPVDSKDEIGTLAREFQSMARSVQAAERDLQMRIQERTEELERSQENLIRSEKLAAIGALASGVGHELRNPLAVIQNAIFYLRGVLLNSSLSKNDPSIKEFMDVIEREIKSSTSILSDLLDFSREIKLTIQFTDVNELLDDTLKVMEIPSSVKLIKNYSTELPPIKLDAQRMRQVFFNLATNAIQSMPTGGTLRITTTTAGGRSLSQSFILVKFEDTGVGINEQDKRKVFDPLFTTKAKGTGLGLAICLSLVEKHGGKIDVSSVPGEGTSMTVMLPQSESKEFRGHHT